MQDNLRADALAKSLESKFGHNSASLGSKTVNLDVVPTGILALDYALGTGGWPLRHPVEVFGPPDIGKSSVIGHSALRNAQAMGKLCVLIALEPGFDPAWAEKNGVDVDNLVISRPNNGEEAFSVLYTVVAGDAHADFVVFDSIGAIVSEIEQQEDAKSRVGGQSKLITDGVKRILMPCWKNNVGVIFLNQVRDQMNSRIAGQVESPGGHALKHSAAIRVQLKQKGSPIKAKIQGEEDPVIIGRDLVAIIQRNKLSEGSQRKALFTYYQMETDDHPVGIDSVEDILNTAIRCGVIQKTGGWYRHRTFPNKLNGVKVVAEHFADHPQCIPAIRDDVLRYMIEKQAKKKATKPELEVIDGEGA